MGGLKRLLTGKRAAPATLSTHRRHKLIEAHQVQHPFEIVNGRDQAPFAAHFVQSQSDGQRDIWAIASRRKGAGSDIFEVGGFFWIQLQNRIRSYSENHGHTFFQHFDFGIEEVIIPRREDTVQVC